MSDSKTTIFELDQWLNLQSKIERIELAPFGMSERALYLLREDALIEEASGNKLRKLLPNLKVAAQAGIKRIVTFGGAFSNHIAATAAAGKRFGFETFGIIRGRELVSNYQENPTLRKASDCGMNLLFISRTEYKNRHDPIYLSQLNERFAPCIIIPEGGSNEVAIEGVTKMVGLLPQKFKVLCTPIGTGGTMAGLLNGAYQGQQIWGFSALKGIDFESQLRQYGHGISRRVFDEYHFGGYAKANNELIEFINNFKVRTGIPLDPIYTGKMMYGLMDLLKKKPSIKSDEILAIHTGGLQGILGFNQSNKDLIKIF